MYEDRTYETLLREKLELVSETLDKREGSIIYDAMAPNSVESAMIYIAFDVLLNETFADTASRGYLIRRCAERGISPHPATAAVGVGNFNIDLPVGTRFSCDKYNWRVNDRIGSGRYYMTCETPGADPNRYIGTLSPIEYINGLTFAELSSIEINGEDDENTEALRLRYLASFSGQSYGFNRAQYIEVASALPGVGGVKPYRAWNGPGTVLLVITSSENDIPSDALIDAVQTAIDPTQNSGEGLGLAGIDHEVTVAGVTGAAVNITSRLTYSAGWSFTECQPYIEATVDGYLRELNAAWADSSALIVRVAYIEARLLGLEGIVDVSDTMINGASGNFELKSGEIAVRGDFSDD